MLELYENIRNRRKELGYSQQELADLVGYTGKSMIAKVESGKVDLPVSMIKKFADALKINPNDLMGNDGIDDEKVPTYSPDQAELLMLYNQINDNQKRSVLDFLRSFASN